MPRVKVRKKKKIKGQIPGNHYSWLVAVSVKRRCQVSDVLAEIVNWICSDDRLLPEPMVKSTKTACGSHTYLNFNADNRLLEKWEHFKKINRIKADSHAIRAVVEYRYGLVQKPNVKSPTLNGKPISQTRLF